MHLASSLSLCQFCTGFQRCKLSFVFPTINSQNNVLLKTEFPKIMISYLKISPSVTCYFLSITYLKTKINVFKQCEAFTMREKTSIICIVCFPTMYFYGSAVGTIFCIQWTPSVVWNVFLWYSNNHKSNVALSHRHGHYHLNKTEERKVISYLIHCKRHGFMR